MSPSSPRPSLHPVGRATPAQPSSRRTASAQRSAFAASSPACSRLASRNRRRLAPRQSRPPIRRQSVVPARRGQVAARSARSAPFPCRAAQASARSPHAQHPAMASYGDRIAEPTPPMSLQPAPVVRLPSSCLGLAVSRVVHVKSRVRSASPCHRSRVVQLVHALAFACAQCVDGTPSTFVYPLVYVRLPLVYPHVHSCRSPSPARRDIVCSSRSVRARCACCSHVSSCVLHTLIIRLT
jgi:hypothetical protein